jgi:ABC-2 type transport system permease protein
MRYSLQVARWELTQNLRNRQFLLLTILLPVILMGAMAISVVIGSSSPTHDATGGSGLQKFVDQLQSGSAGDIQAVIPIGLAMSFFFIFLFVILFSGQLVLQNVVREKQSRIVEILLSAVSPQELMVGKILGFGALGLVQGAIWVLVSLLLLVIVGPYLGVPALPLLSVLLANMPWDKFLLDLVYFVLGYLLVAAISAGMAATMTDLMSGQQFQQVIIMLPTMIPYFIIGLLIQDPNGLLARIFSFIPPTIAGTMMMRTAIAGTTVTGTLTAPISPWEIMASFVILLVSVIMAIRAASKVFEIGILLYGKSISLREIWRWARR